MFRMPRWTYFSRAVYEAAGLVDVCLIKAGANSCFLPTADQLLLLMSQVARRPTCVDRGAGTAVVVGSGRTLLDFFKLKSATEGAKESPVLMDCRSGGVASSDADVVATGVVNRGEGGAGAGSDADVVVTGVVNGPEDCEGAGFDMDGVFSDAADGTSLADRTLVHAPIYCAGSRSDVREPVLQHCPSLSTVLATRGCCGRLG